MADMDENLIKRIMPHDDDTERAVLGTILINQEELPVVCEYITSADFYNRQYGAVFEAMQALYNNGQVVDPVTLHNKLSEMDVPPETATMEFMSLLINSAAISGHAASYARDLADMSTSRQLIRINEEIAGQCYSAKTPLPEILEDTEKKIFELLQSRNSSEFVPIKNVVAEAMAQIEKASRTKGGVTGLSTGFADLDRKTSGLQPGNLILVAARPSMGKTAFVLNIAEHLAVKHDKTVAIFSLEMPSVDLVKRIMAMNGKIDASRIRDGQLAKSDWHSVVEAAGNVALSRLIIDDSSSLSVTELRSKARKYKLEHDVDIIMIDYLQLMSGSGSTRSESSRNLEISEISRSLKALARELNIPVVALSQLSRGVESRSDHRPMLSDLRDSGAIEQDADVVMFLYRDDYYNKDSEKKGISEVIIAKQRNGPIGMVELAWIPEFTKFTGLDHSKRQDRD